MSKKRSNVSNQDVFLVAANNIGADRQFVDAEDVYVEAHRLTPHRFSWRTKRELIDLATLERVFRKVSSTKYLIKEGKYLLRLSSLGLFWVQKNELLINNLNGNERSGKSLGMNRNTVEINRFKKTKIYQKWLEDGGLPGNKYIVAEALGCMPNKPLSEFERRLNLLAVDAQFAEDFGLKSFLEILDFAKKDWFEERSV